MYWYQIAGSSRRFTFRAPPRAGLTKPQADSSGFSTRTAAAAAAAVSSKGQQQQGRKMLVGPEDLGAGDAQPAGGEGGGVRHTSTDRFSFLAYGDMGESKVRGKKSPM
jgi:hypothetical protein